MYTPLMIESTSRRLKFADEASRQSYIAKAASNQSEKLCSFGPEKSPPQNGTSTRSAICVAVHVTDRLTDTGNTGSNSPHRMHSVRSNDISSQMIRVVKFRKLITLVRVSDALWNSGKNQTCLPDQDQNHDFIERLSNQRSTL